jgi:hypothetical protein
MCLNVPVQRLVRQKNRPAWLLPLRPAAENPSSILPEQVSESAEIRIRDPIEVPRCQHQSGTLYINQSDVNQYYISRTVSGNSFLYKGKSKRKFFSVFISREVDSSD